MLKKFMGSELLSGIVSGVVAGVVAPIALYLLGSIYLNSWATLSSEVNETSASLLGTSFRFVLQEKLSPVSPQGSLVLNINGEAKTMHKGSEIHWPKTSPKFVITLEDVEMGSAQGSWVARFKVMRELW